MAEYIEREAAFNAITDLAGKASTRSAYEAIWKSARALKKIPAADVAPVVHGRWIFGKDLPYSWGQIPKNKYHLYCSECLEQAFNRSEDNDPDFDVDTSYCPNCGAKMDGSKA